MARRRWLCFVVAVGVLQGAGADSDIPCASLAAGGSVVCVCDETHCDTVTRDAPAAGEYRVYTSNEAGLRLKKSSGKIENVSNSIVNSILTTITMHAILQINSDVEYQTVEGFGGAVTDAAGINWKKLSKTTQQMLIDSYFSATGLEYNMLRVPIGGSDFSTHAYAYNEQPENDTLLSNFTLSPEDYEYKLPMIKSLLSAATSPVHIVATVWSPPIWMKTNNKYLGASRLKKEYYQTYADYHLRFLEHYAAESVDIWAITTTNEPINGVIPIAQFNSLGWTPSSQSQWIVDNLGPTIRSSRFNNTKILAVDDQRYTVPIWLHGMVKHNKSVLEFMDGVAVHYYGDIFSSADIITWTHDHFPGKFILGTEACEGAMPWEFKKVVLGSWKRAESYILDILEDLNHWIVGWIDWNLCLSSTGGPNWADNFADSPILVFTEKDQFYKQPMFYAMGHFSKFIPRGSKRVDMKSKGFLSVKHAAFKTPRGTLVIVLYNSGSRRRVQLLLGGDREIDLQIEAKTIKTIEMRLD